MVVAGIAINHFFEISNCAKVGIFIQDFQKKIDAAWNSERASFEFKGSLPRGIDYICFANLSETINGNTIEKEIYVKDINTIEEIGTRYSVVRSLIEKRYLDQKIVSTIKDNEKVFALFLSKSFYYYKK